MGPNKDALLDKISALVDENRQLGCASAHRIATEEGVTSETVGDLANKAGIRVVRCQLGLFGHAPKKAMNGYRTVKQLKEVSEEVSAALLAGSKDGGIECAATWEIGAALSVAKAVMSDSAETLGIKIRSCQLGCF